MLREHFKRTAASALVIFAALLWAAWGACARADTLDGVLEVRSAYVNVDHGVFLLHSRIQYPMNPMIQDALRDGVTLTFDLETRVARERRFWFDADIVELTMRRELSYHTVSERYVVRDVRSGARENFPSLDAALEYLGTIDGWPVLVEPQLSDIESYRIAVRAGVRRGRLPASLRLLMFWTDDWYRVSEWYSWSLPM
jgi:hypothetical protein